MARGPSQTLSTAFQAFTTQVTTRKSKKPGLRNEMKRNELGPEGTAIIQ